MDCVSKITVQSKTGQTFHVGCGVCLNCRTKRLRSWMHRLSVEEEHCCSSFFITLTYDNDTLEFSKDKCPMGFNLPTLNKKTLQNFIKLLRYYEKQNHKKNKTKQQKPIKYYAVGEYGSKKNRPHYHILIYNLIYWKNSLTQAWKNGNIHIGEVSNQSIAYTLSYVTDKTFKTFENDPRQKPFSLSSLGLGQDYLKDEVIKYHKDNDALYATLKGVKYPLSDYYKKKIWTDDQLRQQVGERISEQLQDEKLVYEKNFIKEHGNEALFKYIYDKQQETWIKEQKSKLGKGKLLD